MTIFYCGRCETAFDWVGSKKGVLHKATKRQVRAIVRMKRDGERITSIAEVTRLSRPTVYRILQRVEDGQLSLSPHHQTAQAEK